MGNFNLTITNEGAALLADVIANQGSLEFTEVRFSSTNYVGSEAALTEGTFGGTFITAVPSASILSQTTIDIAASFDNTTFTIAKQLYSIGVIAEDGDGNTALVAVCTTSVPDTIPAYMAPGSNYAFNINMTVSSTDHITVTGSVSGVLYVADIVDNLDSHETNKPLSANQGRILKELIPSSGMFPHVIVISDSGSVVTLTKGAKVITATETSAGHFEADVDEYGTWTIDSILGGDDAQTTLNVDAVKVYTITDEHFSASVTVSYPSGGTCTLSATGQTPQVATSSPYTFTVHAAATYTLTATYRGATRTATVAISTTGQTETYSFLVDGATVLTTDDVEIWLDCACLWDKNYTTEAEIIADSEAFLALITDSNAMAYMVRSTSFRTAICADALSMVYIGEYYDCVDALMKDSTWANAIASSDYFDVVLTNAVPTMTSDTTPSGVASASAEPTIGATTYYAWWAFARDRAKQWLYSDTNIPAGSSDTGWIQYQFTSPKRINAIGAWYRVPAMFPVTSFTVKGSNDGTNFDSIATGTSFGRCYGFVNNNSYTYYRLEITARNDSGNPQKPVRASFLAFYEIASDGTLPSHTLKTFATATEQEIAEMVLRADKGEIDLYDDAGWRVGQEHSTYLELCAPWGNEQASQDVGETQPAHTATLVLTNHGGVELVDSVLDKQGQTRTQCSFEYDWKNCFPEKGYMNSSQSNSGSWDSCARRDWCNYALRNAVSPYIRAASKQFKTITAESYSGSTNKTSNDYFALRAEKELFGSQTYSNSTEAAALSQITLYDSAASRTKLLGDNGSATPWWERSPNYQGAQFFCNLSNTGEARRDYANAVFGIAPFGVF